MAGKKGQKWSRPMTQHQRDSIALTKIEKFLDKQIDGELKDWTPTRLKALEIRYNKLRPHLSAADINAKAPQPMQSEEELVAKLGELLHKYPELGQKLLQGKLGTIVPGTGTVN